ncbi:MAG: PAS domain S-box protein [Daejeonella sp.]
MILNSNPTDILAVNVKLSIRLLLGLLLIISPLTGIFNIQYLPEANEFLSLRLLESGFCLLVIISSFRKISYQWFKSLLITNMGIFLFINNFILLSLNNFNVVYLLESGFTFITLTFFCRKYKQLNSLLVFNMIAIIVSVLTAKSIVPPIQIVLSIIILMVGLGYLFFSIRLKFIHKFRKAVEDTISLNETLKISQKELNEKREDLKALIYSVNDLIYEIDADYTYLNYWCNNRELIQFSDNDFIGKTVPEIMGAEKSKEITNSIDESIRTGKTVMFDTQSVIIKGNKWFNVRVTPIPNTQNQKPRVSVVIQDITTKKQIENDFLRSQQRLLESQKIAGLGYWEYDIESKTIILSDQIYNIFQLPKEETNLLQTITSRIHPDDRKRIIYSSKLATITGHDTSFEHKLLLPDLSQITIYTAFKVIKDEDGNSVKFSGISQNVTNIRSTEAQLQQSQSHLHSLISSINEIVFELNEDLVCLNVWCRDGSLFQSPESFIGKTVEESLGVERSKAFIKIIKRVIQTHQVENIEFPSFVKSDKWFNGKISLIYDLNNEYTGRVSVVVSEITDRKNALDGIKEREIQLLQAQRTAKMGSWTLDLRSSELFWSENTARVLEIDPQILKNADLDYFMSLVHPEDRELFNNSSFYNSDKSLKRFDHRLITPKGNLKYLSTVTGQKITNRDGEVIKIVGIIQDITERKRAEIEFHNTERSFRNVLENIRLIALTLDIEGNVLFCNEFLADMLGLKTHEITGKNWLEVFSTDEFKHSYKTNILTENIESQHQNVLLSKYGEERMINWFNTILKDETGAIVGMTSIGEDITELLKSKEELIKSKEDAEKASSYKSDFLSTMSHEIRTPMNAVIGITHLLMADEPKPNQIENLNTLKYSAENLLSLINDILDYNKIEAGKMKIEYTPFNLKDFVKNVHNSFIGKSQEKGIELELDLDPKIPLNVLTDKLRLSQVLNNLIGNAVKFTPKGKVSIRVIKVDQNPNEVVVKFEIQDTGIGISKSQSQKIFEPFIQESDSTSREFGGTGLGLAITKRLIDLLDGEISYKSIQGKGTTFQFTISMILGVEGLTDRLPLPVDTPEKNNIKGMKILIVDDNSINLLVGGKFLRNWEAVVDTASDGKIALDKALENDYDVIIMDLQMPVMDGFTSARLIKDKKPLQIILALTADAMPETNNRALEAGMVDYFTKPFVPAELYSKLSMYYLNNKGLN